MNKFTRDHYEFAILQPPFSANVMAELRAVSDSWLAGETEKGFSLGFFDEQYLNQAPVAVVYDPDHRIVAFANIMPQGNHQTTSIDLMRSSKSAPSGIMDTVFVHLFEQARDDGYAYFNMGMAPLSGVGVSRYSFIQEKNCSFNLRIWLPVIWFSGITVVQREVCDRVGTEVHCVPKT